MLFFSATYARYHPHTSNINDQWNCFIFYSYMINRHCSEFNHLTSRRNAIRHQFSLLNSFLFECLHTKNSLFLAWYFPCFFDVFYLWYISFPAYFTYNSHMDRKVTGKCVLHVKNNCYKHLRLIFLAKTSVKIAFPLPHISCSKAFNTKIIISSRLYFYTSGKIFYRSFIRKKKYVKMLEGKKWWPEEERWLELA